MIFDLLYHLLPTNFLYILLSFLHFVLLYLQNILFPKSFFFHIYIEHAYIFFYHFFISSYCIYKISSFPKVFSSIFILSMLIYSFIISSFRPTISTKYPFPKSFFSHIYIEHAYIFFYHFFISSYCIYKISLSQKFLLPYLYFKLAYLSNIINPLLTL